MDEYLYAIPTQKAIDKLADFVDKVVKPPLCVEFFTKQVHKVSLQDSLAQLLTVMKTAHYTHVPVYASSNKFLGVVTES
ncbi:MAG: CBS domain-containing protein [Candidatus Peribacteria bacterium]|nr:CBS domain-containing protein [Candidatus Peribacteria bacterium]